MNEISPPAQKVDLSVVIPVFNEEENLEAVITELEQVMNGLGRSYEILCIDDKSTDGSLSLLRRLHEERPSLRVLCHLKNYGESAGEATGFASARGEVIITMDADQQNDPADIPALLDALTEDVAAACGIRSIREDDWVKRVSSRIANRFRNLVTGDRIRDAGCTFRALRREALREVPVFNGMHRFLPSILRMQGYRVVEVTVHHRPRLRGKSKYGIGNRLFRGIADCLAMRWYKERRIPAERTSGDGKI